MDKLNALLKEVKAISEKYEEISRLKGEKFNLFDILDRRSNEVKTHSAMIAELLNPKGSHGLGDEFLKLFLNHLNTNVFEQPNTKNIPDTIDTSVFVEYHIGKINDDEAEGGRIDILLSNELLNICIENKVFANDQPFQLLRYHNFLTNRNNPILLYLTLEGNPPEEKSTSKKGCNEEYIAKTSSYYCISYKENILKWLQECLKSSVSYPILRESINQYIILIKSLTNQLTSTVMEEQIRKAILSDISSAEIIKGTFDNAIEYVANRLRDAVLSKLKDDYTNSVGETARSNLSSIFIPTKEGRLGIESFNGKGIFQKNSLFVGVLKNDIEKNRWYWDKCIIIYDKETLFQKLQDFEKGDISIVNEIVNRVKEYINTNKLEVL